MNTETRSRNPVGTLNSAVVTGWLTQKILISLPIINITSAPGSIANI